MRFEGKPELSLQHSKHMATRKSCAVAVAHKKCMQNFSEELNIFFLLSYFA